MPVTNQKGLSMPGINRSGNQPWAFNGRVGLWHDSQVTGSVKIVKCSLIALRCDDSLEWEPFDTSETAASLFPFNPENAQKHGVPLETLRMLARSWSRIYAWFLEEPVRFSFSLPVAIRKGAQRLQNMDEDNWTIEWDKHQRGSVRAQKPNPTNPPSSSLAILGMGLREAFSFLEGDCDLLFKSYKPETTGVVQIAVTNKMTAFLVGSFELTDVVQLNKLPDLRKLEAQGHQYSQSQNAKHIQALESGKSVHAWIVQKKQTFQPPLTWKTEPRILWHDKFFVSRNL